MKNLKKEPKLTENNSDICTKKDVVSVVLGKPQRKVLVFEDHPQKDCTNESVDPIKLQMDEYVDLIEEIQKYPRNVIGEFLAIHDIKGKKKYLEELKRNKVEILKDEIKEKEMIDEILQKDQYKEVMDEIIRSKVNASLIRMEIQKRYKDLHPTLQERFKRATSYSEREWIVGHQEELEAEIEREQVMDE